MNGEPIPTPIAHTPPAIVGGVRRLVYIGLGLFFVGVAILGAILPVLPTTPWLLLASYFFARSSARLHRWIRRSPYFGHLIRDWEMHRGIRLPVKVCAVGVVAGVITLTAVFSGAPAWAKWSASGLGAVGVAVILFVVPTVRRTHSGVGETTRGAG
jgi:uncharacterized membrane protein YbaN (DUF454 family)